MLNSNPRSFDAEIQRLIDLKDGVVAIAKFVRDDPDQHFARLFNECMEAVSARYIESAYTRPQAVLARMIDDGRIARYTQLLESTSAVLLMTALHFRVKSYRSNNPRYNRRSGSASGEAAESLPLFQQLKSFESFAVRGAEPSERAEFEDEKPKLLRLARRMGRLALQAYRRVCAYEAQCGTKYGAFQAVAALAILDEGGKITCFGREPRLGSGRAAPSVVRRVRQLYSEALRQLEE